MKLLDTDVYVPLLASDGHYGEQTMLRWLAVHMIMTSCDANAGLIKATHSWDVIVLLLLLPGTFRSKFKAASLQLSFSTNPDVISARTK